MNATLFDALCGHPASADALRKSMAETWDFRTLFRARMVCKSWAAFVTTALALPAYQARLRSAHQAALDRGYLLPDAKAVASPFDLFQLFMVHDLRGVRAQFATPGNLSFASTSIGILEGSLLHTQLAARRGQSSKTYVWAKSGLVSYWREFAEYVWNYMLPRDDHDELVLFHAQWRDERPLARLQFGGASGAEGGALLWSDLKGSSKEPGSSLPAAPS